MATSPSRSAATIDVGRRLIRNLRGLMVTYLATAKRLLPSDVEFVKKK
jgi:hypothetical protein